MSFDTFGFNPSIMAGIRSLGYVTPTPIQSQAIPPIMQGRDVIGLAQTGTGKTAAFVLPILQRLMSSPRGRVGALVVSPTRELAEQTCEAVSAVGRQTGIRGLAIYGGVSMQNQLHGLRNGIEIAVGCPGRLLDHLWQGTLSLSNLEVLVIDEADRMFDMGFLPDIKNILNCIMKARQTLLFSATMPDDIRRLVNEILHDPVTVKIGQTMPADTVAHTLYSVGQEEKTALLEDILRKTETDSVLVFTRTKFRAERVANQLKRAGHRVASLQGNLSQYERQAAMNGFKGGHFKVLVATDVAARGIDVLDISHVINYDMPDTTDAYIHRIGRTGRIGKSGEAFTFVTRADVPMVHALEKLLNARLTFSQGYDLSKVESAPPAPRRGGRTWGRGTSDRRQNSRPRGVAPRQQARPAVA